MFELLFTERADRELKRLEALHEKAGLVGQIKKSLGYLQANPRHPSLNTHVYESISHPYDASQEVFEAYAQNKTPSAYRIFWCYGPQKGQITLIAVTPHP